MLSKVHGPSTLSRAFSTSNVRWWIPLSRSPLTDSGIGVRGPSTNIPATCPGLSSVPLSEYSRPVSSRILMREKPRSAASQGSPTEGWPAACPRTRKLPSEIRISYQQSDPPSPVQRWSSWIVRIDGAVGTGDSLASARQPARPCRGPQADETSTATAASDQISARRALTRIARS